MTESMISSQQRPGGDDVCIDWCPVSRIPTLQALIDNHWRKGHILARDSDLLRWQYRHRDDASRLSVLLAEAEGETVGMLGIIPVDFCVRGERRSGAWLATWVSAPERRAQRLGLRLLHQAFAEGYDVVGVLGIAGAVEGIYRALRFQLWERIPRWVRVVSPEALESLFTGPTAPPASADARTAWRLAAQKGSPAATPPAVRLVPWTDETAERWSRAWEEQFSPQLWGTWRDASYLRWRYVDHPCFRYELRFAEDRASGGVVGLLVYRVEVVRDRSERIVRVVEFLGTPAAGGALARAVVEAAEEQQAAFVDFFCTSSAPAPALEAAGFVREEALPGALPSRFQPLDFDLTHLNGALWIKPELSGDGSGRWNSSDFYVTRSDGDQDRPQ